jgi:integrase
MIALGNRWLHEHGYDVTMHQLRHTLATQIAEASEGRDLLQLQRLLGHASLATVQTYIRGVVVDVERSLQRVPDPRAESG